MSRLFTLLALLLTAAVSFGLYELSYEVQRLEDELLDTNRAVARERENIAVLNAEWSLMTRPDQLQRKAEQVLSMRTLTARQIVSFDDIPWRKDVPRDANREISRDTPRATEPKGSVPAPEPRSEPRSEVPVARASPAAPATPTAMTAKPARPVARPAPRTNDAEVDAVLASMARRQ